MSCVSQFTWKSFNFLEFVFVALLVFLDGNFHIFLKYLPDAAIDQLWSELTICASRKLIGNLNKSQSDQTWQFSKNTFGQSEKNMFTRWIFTTIWELFRGWGKSRETVHAGNFEEDLRNRKLSSCLHFLRNLLANFLSRFVLKIKSAKIETFSNLKAWLKGWI